MQEIEGSLVEANIEWSSGQNMLGDVGSLRTTSGNFAGRIRARSLSDGSSSATNALDIAGNMTADLSFSQDVIDRIRIGGSLSGAITARNQGLKNLVIVNAANNSSTWTGNVTVQNTGGNVTLSPLPNYSQLTSTVAGSGNIGGVGLVPYRLYAQDCSPPDGGTIAWAGQASVRIRHYGPVQIENPSSQTLPMTVEWSIDGLTNWIDISDDFTYAVSTTDPRDVIVTAILPDVDFDGTVYYRIAPKTTGSNRLLCRQSDLLTSNAVPVTSYFYVLTGTP